MFSVLKNIAKHSIVYGLSDILSRAIGFILIPLYTHYLTPTDYGTLELLDLTSYIIGLFLAMGIAQAVVRFYYEYNDKERRDQVISVAMITLWIVSAIVLAVLIFFSPLVSKVVMKSSDYYGMFNIIFVSMVIGLSNEIPLTVLRIEEKSLTYLSFTLTKLTLTLTLNIIFIVKFHMGVIGILYSGLIASLVIGTVITIYILRRTKISYSIPILRNMLGYSIPLMWSWFGMFIVNFGDRFFLQRIMTTADVGIYSLAYKFGMMPNVLVLSPFLMIWGPKRFDILKDPDAKEIYAKVFTYFLLIQFFVGLGIVIAIKEIIQIVASPDYHDAYKYVAPILLAYIANGVYLYVQFGVHIEKKTKYLAYATILGAILNVAMNLLLIPLIGIWGAAISTFCAFFFLLLYIFFPSQKLYHISYEWGRILHMSITAVALFAAGYFIAIPNVYISAAVKFAIAFTFPFILLVTRFYQPKEIAQMKLMYHSGIDFVGAILGKKKPGPVRLNGESKE
jgi:O-antigen/teichoic acid export membrane protein